MRQLSSTETARARTGHTLVELVVACAVFALGVLSLQRAMLLALVQSRDAHAQEVAVQVASTQLERLAFRSCSGDIDGSETVRGMEMSWSAGAALGRYARPVQLRVSFARSSDERSDHYVAAVRCR